MQNIYIFSEDIIMLVANNKRIKHKCNNAALQLFRNTYIGKGYI